jgi:uncharacterized protein
MPATRTYKTPGVYVAELSSFPPSIVGVETAVPAFIGYTEKAEIGGKPVLLQAIKIRSLAEFEQIFGGAHRPVYKLKAVDTPAADNYDFRVWEPDESDPGYRYYKLETDVGGGDTTDPEGEESDGEEPVARVALAEEDPESEVPPVPMARFALYNSMRLFYANGGANCYVVSVGTYMDGGEPNQVKKDSLIAGLNVIAQQTGPTMLAVPDSVLLPPTEEATPWKSQDFDEVASVMLTQCADLQDRVAILDVYGTQHVNSTDSMEAAVKAFREGVGERGLSYGMAYFPFLDTTVVPLDSVSYKNIDTSDADPVNEVNALLQDILYWESANLYGDPESEQKTPRQKAVDDDIALITDSEADAVQVNQNLTAALPLLKDILRSVVKYEDVLPPSGAMAGIFTYVDTTRGVWNAPANLTLYSVARPTFPVNNAQQADLNMPINGKAVDALREFPGRGTVVWGARTLDGNNNDYRYIQVRRTLIYIQQSIKNALDPFVFAPNTGQTWSTVVSMVSAFLQNLWSQGGLMGATASEAFSVECGLGSTMTGKDILEGYMIVQVTLQMIRPAEFIELTFKQKMEGVS